jgi:hypothetical protein
MHHTVAGRPRTYIVTFNGKIRAAI